MQTACCSPGFVVVLVSLFKERDTSTTSQLAKNTEKFSPDTRWTLTGLQPFFRLFVQIAHAQTITISYRKFQILTLNSCRCEPPFLFFGRMNSRPDRFQRDLSRLMTHVPNEWKSCCENLSGLTGNRPSTNFARMHESFITHWFIRGRFFSIIRDPKGFLD
jgi:hypothetical protein